jgi:hypothetical protein
VWFLFPVSLWVVGIRPAILLIPVRPEVGVDDLPDPLDVHDLFHRLSAGIYGDQVVARLDEISGPTTAESAAAASSSPLTTTTAAGSATDRSFSRTQIHFTGRSPASALPSPTAARKTAAGLHPLAESPQPRSISPRAHRVHAVPYGGERRRVAARRGYAARAGGRVNTSSRA